MFKICIFLNIGITANEGNLNDFYSLNWIEYISIMNLGL